MNTHDDTQLTRHLGREADRFVEHGGRELDLAQVLARAGEIKRGRRMRATMLMAACVLAIAAPTALVVTHRDASTAPQPTSPTQTHEAKVNQSPLSLGDLDVGDSPRHGFAEDGTWQLRVAANGLSALRGHVATAAAVKGGAIVAMQTESGETTAWFIHEQGGTSEQSWPMATGTHFAVSNDGTIATFVAPDGTPMAYQDGAAYPLAKLPVPGGYEPVAAFGPDCSLELDFESCGAWITALGTKPGTWAAWSSGSVDRVAVGLKWVTAVSEDNLIAGIVEAHDDNTTCSEVEAYGTETPRWSVCGYRLTAFSPDAAHVLAKPDGDGPGDRSLAVYSADGKQVLDLPVAHEGFVYQAVWEDDSNVLATVYEQGRWAVLRINLDGSREYAVEPVDAGEDYTQSPFVLPTL